MRVTVPLSYTQSPNNERYMSKIFTSA